ncbi:MAG: acyl-CoA desaturase [Crocinitomicaceae bacterium]|nr:acyl-CoA desaturase [Crocinitomicaceae bacterium]
MSAPHIKFNEQDQPEFFKVVRKRVNAHFKEKNISKYANFNMKFKTFFMITMYFTPLVLMLTGIVNSVWPMMAMWVIMGFGMSGIGLSVMHDANHSAYSKNETVNKVVGFILNFIGGYPANWRMQHNVLHHSFTNIDGYDEDIEKKGIMRFSPNQKRLGFFKFQIFYAPFLYGILTTYWLLVKDFEQIVRYDKKGLLEAQGLTKGKAIIEIIFHKIWYIALTLVLPIYLLDVAWWQVLLGFLLMQFISGMILALIFQPAHVVGETEFFVAEDGGVENNWAIHQMKTTSNFANGSLVFSWLIGGLNYQIEHHLFPNICHVHYKDIAPIVKQTAKEFGVPYYHNKTFYSALVSHFTLLNELGTGAYDKRLSEMNTAV